MSSSFGRRLVPAAAALVLIALVPAVERGDNPITELVPGTAVLLSDTGGGGGNGGNTISTTSSTNIFSPSVFVDYKRFGGEPTVTVDRYPGGNDVTYVSGASDVWSGTGPSYTGKR